MIDSVVVTSVHASSVRDRLVSLVSLRRCVMVVVVVVVAICCPSRFCALSACRGICMIPGRHTTAVRVYSYHGIILRTWYDRCVVRVRVGLQQVQRCVGCEGKTSSCFGCTR